MFTLQTTHKSFWLKVEEYERPETEKRIKGKEKKEKKTKNPTRKNKKTKNKEGKDMMTVQRKYNTKMILSTWSSYTATEVAYFMRPVLKTGTKGKLVKKSILFSKFPAVPLHPSIK